MANDEGFLNLGHTKNINIIQSVCDHKTMSATD